MVHALWTESDIFADRDDLFSVALNVPIQWIVAGAAIVVGIGILAAVKNTRRRDPSE